MQNNLFFELIPLFLFFIVYYTTKNIFLATTVCIIICWMQVLFCKIKYNKVSKNLWISSILITMLGGLTVLLKNNTFIMVKPTALYWIMALVLLISQLLGKNLIKTTLQKEFKLDNLHWNIVNIAWGLFFIFMGGLNLFVAFNYSESIWVSFKVFGALSMLIVFSLLSGLYLYFNSKKSK